ncbi:MAG: transglycosylase family protein [Actinocatenispora sp.]
MSTAYRPRRASTARYAWKPYAALGVQIVAIIAVLGAGGFFLFRTQQVTIVDDGAARHLRSYAGTVGALLRQAGLRLGPHDDVRPGRTATPGSKVVIGRGRRVALTVDGRHTNPWLTVRTVPGLLAKLHLTHTPTQVDGSDGGTIPRSGAQVTVRTRKHVSVVVSGHRTSYTTYAATVRELIADKHLRLAANAETDPVAGHTLAGVTSVSVFRVTRKTVTETVRVPAPKKTEKRDDWMLDQQGVVDSGRDGKRQEHVMYIYRDGKQYQRKVLSSKQITATKPEVVAKGTTPYPPDDTGLNWDGLAQCESGGNPQSVSSNGMYMGLYQFSADTWQRMGGVGLPSEATPREQTYRAIQLYKRSGKDQWPVCGAHL